MPGIHDNNCIPLNHQTKVVRARELIKKRNAGLSFTAKREGMAGFLVLADGWMPPVTPVIVDHQLRKERRLINTELVEFWERESRLG